MGRPSDNNAIQTTEEEEVVDEQTGINRRQYLQFAGLTSLPFVTAGAASTPARAAESGYGVAGYGGGGYGVASSGGITDPAPTVSTRSPTAVDETSATLTGTVDDLGGASTVTASFEYRQAGSDQWIESSTTTLSSPGAYSESIGPLTADTAYEFRAIATGETDRSVGSAVSFSTLAPPAIATRPATAITAGSATLVADLDTLGDSATVATAFEYRPRGTTDWHRTPAVDRSSPGEVTHTVADLEAGTEYEYRAIATGESLTVTADTVSRFTTASAESGASAGSAELSNTLLIDGSHINLSSYSFSVTGEVERADALTTADDSDWYSLWGDNRVVGMVGDGQHGYRYSGDITSLEITGNATVDITRE